MRGEYSEVAPERRPMMELPPRARRIPNKCFDDRGHEGTTSACAENTARDITIPIAAWNYLRVRGEYIYIPGIGHGWGELPPRARRIHEFLNQGIKLIGTTSACAENTASALRQALRTWNYLRVRGEYRRRRRPEASLGELPPRARRILAAEIGCSVGTGTTSACAENTLNELGLL